MAGFQIGRVFELDFADTDAAGAVVKVKSASIGTIVELKSCDLARELEIIAEHVIEWNLEEDGAALPVEAASLYRLEEPFRNLLFNEWMKATRGITVPFDHRSARGGPQPAAVPAEPSIPMEDL